MIDRVKKIVFTILNKEKRGPITPAQFNDSCARIQNSIFSNYFDADIIRSKNRSAKGLANDTVKLYEQRLSPFMKEGELNSTTGTFVLPADYYFIDRRGVTWKSDVNEYQDIDIVKPSVFKKEEPSDVFAIGHISGGSVYVKPVAILKIFIDYYRKPKDPNWTYTISNGVPYFNPTNGSYQDFEVHPSEENNLIMGILSDFGIIKREADISQLITNMKQLEDNGKSRIL